MAKEKASVEVSLDGTAAAVSDINKLDASLNQVGRKASEWGKKTFGSLTGLASGVLGEVTALKGLSIGNAIRDAKALDMATAKLGQSAGISGAKLQSSFDQAEKKTLISSVAMAEFARSLGRASYDGKFAAGSVESLAVAALAAGRDLSDEAGFSLAIQRVGFDASQSMTEIERMADMADRMQTIGGPVALRDTLASLGPLLDSVATSSDESRIKLEALVAVMGKGLKLGQAQAVAGGALSTVKSRALDIERLTGKRVLNDKGEVTDPTAALADIQAITRKKFKGDQGAQRRALISEFGAELGSMIMYTDFSQVGKLAKTATDKGGVQAEANKARETAAGKRVQKQLAVEQAARTTAAKAMSSANDVMQDPNGGPSFQDSMVEAVTDPEGFAKKVTSAPWLTLRDKPVFPWQREYWPGGSSAKTANASSGQVSNSNLSPLIPQQQKANGNSGEAITAALAEMVSAQRETTELLRGHPSAVADALHRAPLKVSVPKNPNEKKGN